MNLSITKIACEQTIILQLKGEVDIYTVPKLKENIDNLLQVRGNTVILDLANVQYLDSTGIGAIIGRLKMAEQNDGRLKLCNTTNRLGRLFSITGLTEIIEIE